MALPAFASPRLVADIGGTHARFALQPAPGRFEHRQSMRCAGYPDFRSAVAAFLANAPGERIKDAVIAIAGPVAGDRVRMTNLRWQFSIEESRRQLGFDNLLVVNDFVALARALPDLSPSHRRQVGRGAPVPDRVLGLIGPGTGLGMSALLRAGRNWIALGSEGGHASFAPRDEREVHVLRHAWRQFPHVSFERLLSGPGIELIHRALGDRAGLAAEPLAAPEITRRALEGEDALCREAIDTFCVILGTAAGNLAVTQGALGGIYIGGGIVPRLGGYFDRSGFRHRFEDMGRFSDYMTGIPTYVITAEDATILGAAALLSAQLDGPPPT